MNTPSRPALRRLLAPGLTLTLIVLAACGADPQAGHEQTAGPSAACSNPLDPRCPADSVVPPFDRIAPGHFIPALTIAIDRADTRLAAIAGNPKAPDFDNTVAALEDAGRQVARIARLWYGLAAIETSPEILAVGEEFSRMLAAHQRRILHDPALFDRIDRLHHRLPRTTSSPQQQRLIDETWRRFRRAGAQLDATGRKKLIAIEQRIERLDEQYRQSRRAATHRHELLINDPERLSKLPESLIELARQTARDRGHESGWAFTLHAHSFYPFMRHFPGRAERRELYQAWMTRYRDVLRSDENLGRVIDRLARLRAERAALLGFNSHIDYLLDDASLPGRDALENLLERLTAAAQRRASTERAALTRLAATDDIGGELKPWDWWYYRQRLLETGRSGTQAQEWLSLETVTGGMFDLAEQLWGLRFVMREDLPAWHPEMKAYEVLDRSGASAGIVYLDLIHRHGKRGGAWTSQYRVQAIDNGRRTTPILAVVANLAPAGDGRPTLLSTDQVRTLFHELGHALHGLLSDVELPALAGTNVPPDFVEFPALLLERWSLEPEVVGRYARHYQTGVPLSHQTAAALARADRPTPGLETLELIAAIELDLALHGAGSEQLPDLETAERRVRERLALPAMISPRHHGGGLASVFARQRHGGDFRTLWSEVLASDAFAAFKRQDVVDRRLAERLRAEILSRGNSRSPMDSWSAFRGRAPDIGHLIEARGLTDHRPAEIAGAQVAAKTPGGE